MAAILRGKRPGKPVDAESLGFSDTLWGLVQLCWSESVSDRPTARQLLDCLSLASLAWVPPLVYPITVADTSTTAGPGSSTSAIPPPLSLGKKAIESILERILSRFRD